MPETIEKKRTLIQISNDLIALEELLIETGGDITDEQVAEAIEEWFAEFESDLDTKTDNYVALIRSKELTAAMAKEESERLAMRAKVETNQVASLKERLKFALQRLNKKKAGKMRTATVCGNGGKVPLIFDEDAEMKAPPRFQSVKVVMTGEQYAVLAGQGHLEDCVHSMPVIDTDAVRDALEAGEELPFARFAERGSHLRIK